MNNRIIAGRILALIVVLILVFACVGFFLSGGSTPAHALEISCTPVQANFAPDNVVKNGHSLDQNDLYTRHLNCAGESNLESSTGKSDEQSVQTVDTEIPATSTQVSPPTVSTP